MKFLVTFDNGRRALMKPGRYPHGHVLDENTYVWDNLESHVGEIASYHLDKVGSKILEIYKNFVGFGLPTISANCRTDD